MPRRLPDAYSPGEASEAIVYAVTGKAAWVATAGAVEWLKGGTRRGAERRSLESDVGV